MAAWLKVLRRGHPGFHANMAKLTLRSSMAMESFLIKNSSIFI